MKETENLSRLEKRNALIHAIDEARKEHGCTMLEVAEACKTMWLCACAAMGVNAQDVMGEEVKPDEMLVVPKEDALD